MSLPISLKLDISLLLYLWRLYLRHVKISQKLVKLLVFSSFLQVFSTLATLCPFILNEVVVFDLVNFLHVDVFEVSKELLTQVVLIIVISRFLDLLLILSLEKALGQHMLNCLKVR